MALETVQAGLPEDSILFNPPGYITQRLWLQGVTPLPAAAPLSNQVGVAQNAQMLADGRPGLAEIGREGIHWDGPAAQPVQNRTPRRVGDGTINIGRERAGGRRFETRNHLVT